MCRPRFIVVMVLALGSHPNLGRPCLPRPWKNAPSRRLFWMLLGAQFQFSSFLVPICCEYPRTYSWIWGGPCPSWRISMPFTANGLFRSVGSLNLVNWMIFATPSLERLVDPLGLWCLRILHVRSPVCVCLCESSSLVPCHVWSPSMFEQLSARTKNL